MTRNRSSIVLHLFLLFIVAVPTYGRSEIVRFHSAYPQDSNSVSFDPPIDID